MQVERGIEHYRADALYFEAHRQELLRQYDDHWVAVYDQRVVATAREHSELLDQLDRQGFPRGEVFIEYLSAKEDLLILSWV